MADGSTTERRSRLADLKKAIDGADSKNDLIAKINETLDVPEPDGDPATVRGAASRYKKAAGPSDEAHVKVRQVAASGLPDVWTGTTGVKAAESVAATGRAVQQMTDAFQEASTVLLRLSDSLEQVQKLDTDGRSDLRQALSILGSEDGFFDDWVEKDAEEAERKRAQGFASNGAGLMHRAAVVADDAARAAARDLNKLASEARAGKMATDELSATDRIALADTSSADGPAELNEILTATDLQRSGQRMERMNARDRAEFEKMLSEAKSPEERAYLTKALAAGHDMDTVREFRGKIHGRDPQWLREHLTPVWTADDSMKDEGRNDDGSNVNTDSVAHGSQQWSQGGNRSEGTCVASSTVNARAMVDPVYALQLIGGESGTDDSEKAFRERLIDEQHRVHEDGDGGDGWNGMGREGKEEVLGNEISPHTGAEYEYRDLREGADARRDVLPEIEKAVAEGQPVPIGVEGTNAEGERTGHAMMIIGQEGDMLQVYNPWGTTTWVSEEDFIHGRMDKASDNRMPNAYAVHIPK
ncbi:WXG100 family type VII secretion target [Streptomyces thermolineatus]|uniref:WXG100 family type VII secretion target n=1 Tax=Streptomyces thermolineatus TaxID=44033 RepID=UPI00384F334C